MNLLPGLRLLLAAQVVCTSLSAEEPGVKAQGTPVAENLLKGVDFEGGSPDDLAFARVAASLPVGAHLSAASFEKALAAIRATDRFRTVEGNLVERDQGVRAQIRLDPWPPLEHLAQEGLPKGHPRLPRLGDRLGNQKLEGWREQFQTHLRESGYPQAQVSCQRTDEDQGLRVGVVQGPAARVTRVEVTGSMAPYRAARLIRIAKIVPGKTLWTEPQRLDSLARLRKRFTKDKRFEGEVDMVWEPASGLLRLTVNAGPVVALKADGDSLGWNVSLKDLVPLARANRYSPEILDEGERRIVRTLRAKGYLDAQVTHRREVKHSGPAGPEAVLVTYTITRGALTPIKRVRFENNKAISEAELRKAADLPFSLFSSGGPVATPDLVDGVESRVKALYESRGYTDAKVRLLPLVRKEDGNELVYRVYEGPCRLVRWLKLDLPPGAFGDPWGLGEALTLILSDHPLQEEPSSATVRRFKSDRSPLGNVQGVLENRPDPARGGAPALTLTLSRAIPLQKNDLAKILNALRQKHLASLGVARPVVRFTLEGTGNDSGIRLEVPEQPLGTVERLVVQGGDRTHAQAILRETQLKPGAPLNLDTLSRMQARLGYLGAFQRVDLTNLADSEAAAGEETPAKDGPPVPWQQGDLLLHLEERSPWQVTSSFGYDQTQGYHIGTGVQRLNVGGMGRTVDFGIRAGDGTINSETLRKIFYTGPYDRSVDSYSLGYTDPWFAEGLLPDHTQMNMEGAYIEERRSLYLLHRRRFLSSLQWLITPQVSLQMGYRFERVDVKAARDDINSEELALDARYPAQATISAPYLQVARDTRDNPLDPTRGTYSVARLELADQFFLTSRNASFVKLDLRQQWTWPMGANASAGVVALGVRVGMARPTAASAQNLPLSERFFAGGPFTQRGVQPDGLGPLTLIPMHNPNPPFQTLYGPDGVTPLTQSTPVGGEGLAIINLEYRFPFLGKTIWGEVFLDSGQVYESLTRQAQVPGAEAQFPPFRTSMGLGLIFKLSIPIKLEYAGDINRILGRPRPANDVTTQLKGLLVSAGFQF